jgi:D-tyrosyl-tRNA(Tyr) deacylase
VGIGRADTETDTAWMASKLSNLRIFPDNSGSMNLSLLDTGGEILAVSQFTLHADCSRGRRPSFIGAGDPATASALFDIFVERLRALGFRVGTGVFGAMMSVELVNEGPVTIMLDSPSEGGP